MMSTDGADPFTDASAIAYLDRLTRYARHAERSYYRAIRELRAIQNERAAREKELDEQQPRVIEVRWIEPETEETPEMQNELSEEPPIAEENPRAA